MSHGQTILVIDDDPSIHRLVELRIRDLGATILTSPDGASGIRAAHEAEPHLILLDVNLPDMSGFEIFERLRNDPATRDIPILFLTGSDQADEVVRAFEMGAVDYVTKPFDAAELRARVRAALRMQSLLHALEVQALSDSLTGMPNREAFRRALAKRLDQARQGPQSGMFALLFIDLDRFKIVNDSLGHAIGDELLVQVANRLFTCLRTEDGESSAQPSHPRRPPDIVARMGGDESAILLQNVSGRDAVVAIAERILENVGRTYDLAGHQVYCGTSIGIRICTGECGSVDTILRDGDTAMYHAKAAGKGRYAIFDEGMHKQVLRRLKIEDELRQAIGRHELQVAYQPIVNLRTGRLEGFEALARWTHSKLGPIGPDEFIPIAEETGLVQDLGRWILRQSCRQMRKWNDRFSVAMTMHVNVSKAQFISHSIVDSIADTLRETSLDPAHLVLEITESVIMHDSRIVVPILASLRSHGIRLAMDDFGTGYSSLAALHRFPINVLKIDREFIQRLADSRPYAAIIQAIVSLAHNLNLNVVAEGVETDEEVSILQALDCDLAQGYHFSKPIAAHAATNMLAAEANAKQIAA